MIYKTGINSEIEIQEPDDKISIYNLQTMEQTKEHYGFLLHGSNRQRFPIKTKKDGRLV